jgi:ATP-dependent exoDNAse (exonuclease V) alpha subunit
MKETFKSNLNEGQKNLFDSLEKFCSKENKKDMCSVQGYAGTGKTYTLTRFFSYLISIQPKVKIVMSAPTNKAVGVLKTHTPKDFSSKISFDTIHKILGLSPIVTLEGEEVYVQKRKPILADFDYIIIDETSMLSDELFFTIKNILKNANTKVIFMGDPKQIPPIGKIDCEPFLNPLEHDIETYYLTQIMRQSEGNSIIEASYYVRDNISSRSLSFKEFHKEGQFEVYDSKSENDRLSLKNEFEAKFSQEYIDDIKVIAWRNDKVYHYNQYIRGIIHKSVPSQLPQLIAGELLISNTPVFEGKNIIVSNNTELKVLSFTSDVEQFLYPKKGKKKAEKLSMQYFLTQVSYYDHSKEEDVIVEINVLKDEFRADFDTFLKKWKDHILRQNEKIRKPMWVHYYDMKEFFANVSYAYSLTAHKSQGSTYKEVFVDISDINFNHNIVERNRVIYTSITRASQSAKIII